MDIYKKGNVRTNDNLDEWNNKRIELGRPLWERYALGNSLPNTIKFAKAKLTRSTEDSFHDQTGTRAFQARLAALGCRVAIQFFPGSPLASSLISGPYGSLPSRLSQAGRNGCFLLIRARFGTGEYRLIEVF